MKRFQESVKNHRYKEKLKFMEKLIKLSMLAAITLINIQQVFASFSGNTPELLRTISIAQAARKKTKFIEQLNNSSPQLQQFPHLRAWIIANHDFKIAEEYRKDNGLWRKLTNTQQTITKTNVERVENAQRMQYYITEHNLEHLAVASKGLIKTQQVFAKGCSSETKLQDTWVVVAKKFSGVHWMQGPPVNEPEIKDLATLVTKTGYQDFWGANENVIRSAATNKLTFINTESASFFNGHNLTPTKLDLLLNLKDGVADNIEPQALSWLNHYIKTSELDNDKTPVTHIFQQTQFKSPYYDFSKVRQEYNELEGL